MCPQWSEPYGLDADPLHQLRIDQELAAAGIRRPVNTIGTGIGGPTILHAGTPEQIEKYVPQILTVEEIWCQLFFGTRRGFRLCMVDHNGAQRRAALCSQWFRRYGLRSGTSRSVGSYSPVPI